MMHRKDNGTGSRAPLIGGTSSSRGNGGGKLIAAMMAAAALTLLGAVGLIANVASPGKKTDPSATAEASIEDVSAERSYPLPDRRFRSRPVALEAEPPPAPAVESAAPEDGKTQHLARHERAIAAHGREPLNPGWARDTTRTIDGAIGHLAEAAKFRHLGTDCRSRTCVTTVDWESAGVAFQEWGKLLVPDYGPCGVEVMLDDSQSASQRFRTNVIFNCSGQ